MSDPILPAGFDNEANFAQQVHNRVFGKSGKLRNTRTVKVSRNHNGIFLRVKPGKGGKSAPSQPVAVAQFAFVQSYRNYVIGRNLATNVLTQIAKPYLHRNSNTNLLRDGQQWTLTYPQNPAVGVAPTSAIAFVSRTATRPSDGYFEYQRITDPWTPASGNPSQPADVFYAMQVPATGVVSEQLDTITPVGTAITWLDMNTDGRAWAATPDGNP